ncbi:MAG: response regulator, partial [Candidatus Margulisiibacteriota bacterium]
MDDKLTVLVIDDELDVNNEIFEVIKETGFYNVIKAYSGKEALYVLEHASADIIFLDIKMPDMWGIDVLKELKKKHPDTAVIMLTALSEAKYAWEAAEAGAFD